MLRQSRKGSSGGDAEEAATASGGQESLSTARSTRSSSAAAAATNNVVQTKFNRDLGAYKLKLETAVKKELESNKADKVIHKLMELQHLTLMKPQPDAFVTALAQLTISTILQHLHVSWLST